MPSWPVVELSADAGGTVDSFWRTTEIAAHMTARPTREAINKLPWILDTQINTQIIDADGQKLSHTVIVKARQGSEEKLNSQRRNRSLTPIVNDWQKTRKAAALGLEPCNRIRNHNRLQSQL